jgi:hypothetical protein
MTGGPQKPSKDQPLGHRTIVQTKNVSKDLPIYARDYKTYTFLPIPDGARVEVLAWGQWNIYDDPNRPCGPGGSGIPANNGGDHGDWPISGITEGCMLVWFDNDPHYFPWTLKDGVPWIPFTFRGSNLGFGPNDNHIEDNTGYITVRVSWTK